MNEHLSHQLDAQNGAIQITVQGDILSTNADALRADMFRLLDSEEARNQSWQILKLDLTTAKMLDSVGLNLLVALIRQAKNRGAKTQVHIHSASILRTFQFTGLTRQMEVVQT